MLCVKGKMYQNVPTRCLSVPEGFMYSGVMGDKQGARIIFADPILGPWKTMLAQKRIGQQAAIERLIEFLLAQDDLTQSMILGQVKPSDDLLSVSLKRVAAKRKNPFGPRPGSS